MDISIYTMAKNRTLLLIIPILALSLFSCNNNQKAKKSSEPKAQVKTTLIKQAYLPDYYSALGTTIYLNKNILTAPINGYISKVKVQQGDKVEDKSILFEIQSPEAYVLNKNTNKATNYGTIKVTAPTSGRIVDLKIVNPTIYVNKGDVLCTLLASKNLNLKVKIPFSDIAFVKIGASCKVILPDNSILSGTFSKIIPQLNKQSQTVKVLATINTNRFIPENMRVKVLVDKGNHKLQQVLPMTCLQTDALMNNFWVMKLINDSTAIRVPVEIGNQTHTQVEIIKPEFNKNDQIIMQGAYGLGDTALVTNLQLFK